MSACVQHFAVHKGHKCIFHVFIFVTRHCCSVCCSCCSVAVPLRSDGAAQSPHKQQKTSLALRNLPLTWAGQTKSGNTRQRTCSLYCFKKRKTRKIKIILITKCSVGMVVSIHLAQNALSAAFLFWGSPSLLLSRAEPCRAHEVRASWALQLFLFPCSAHRPFVKSDL